MTRKTYFVSPLQGGWKVTKEGGLVLGTYPTEDGAMQAARIVAKSNQPSEVMVQFKDGAFRTAWTYDHDPSHRPDTEASSAQPLRHAAKESPNDDRITE
jgi:hypothetical protein